MATLEQLAEGIKRAHAAGDADNVRRLGEAYRQMQGQTQPPANPDAGFDPMRDLPIPGTTHPGRPPAEPSMVPWLDPVTAFANNAVDSVPVAGPTLTNMRQNA